MHVSPTYEHVSHEPSSGHGAPRVGKAGGHPTGLFGFGFSADGGLGPLDVLGEPPCPLAPAPAVPPPPLTEVVHATAKSIVKQAKAFIAIELSLPPGTGATSCGVAQQDRCRAPMARQWGGLAK